MRDERARCLSSIGRQDIFITTVERSLPFFPASVTRVVGNDFKIPRSFSFPFRNERSFSLNEPRGISRNIVADRHLTQRQKKRGVERTFYRCVRLRNTSEELHRFKMVRGSGGCLACPDNRSFVSLGTGQLADPDRTCYLCRLWERARATEIREGRSRGHSRSISGSLFRFGFSPLSNRLDSYILFVYPPLFLCQIRRLYRSSW